MKTTEAEEAKIQKIMEEVVLWREAATLKLQWRIAEYLREHQFAKAVTGSDANALKVKKFFKSRKHKPNPFNKLLM